MRKILLITGALTFLLVSYALSQKTEIKNPPSLDPYIGNNFYDATKLIPGELRRTSLVSRAKPAPYKEYLKIPKIKLPEADFRGMTVEEAIEKRRSKRQEISFSREPITLAELSQLLFSASGITGRFLELELRAAPSAGALYPIELYLVVGNVAQLEPGIYHYSPKYHNLSLIKRGDFGDKITQAVMNQPSMKNAAVVFIFSAIPARTTHKYGLRGWRYVYMEIGYISENIYLAATSLGISTTAVGAFYDEEVNQLLGLDGREEMALHVQVAGKAQE